MREITVEWLWGQDTPHDQMELFERTFGRSAELTVENLLRAAEAGLDLRWIAERLRRTQSPPAAGSAHGNAGLP